MSPNSFWLSHESLNRHRKCSKLLIIVLVFCYVVVARLTVFTLCLCGFELMHIPDIPIPVATIIHELVRISSPNKSLM